MDYSSVRGLQVLRTTGCPQLFALGMVGIDRVRNLHSSAQWKEEIQMEEVYVAFVPQEGLLQSRAASERQELAVRQ